jgi:hypothetical protein
MTQSTRLAALGVAVSLALAGLANKALSDHLKLAGGEGQGWLLAVAQDANPGRMRHSGQGDDFPAKVALALQQPIELRLGAVSPLPT